MAVKEKILVVDDEPSIRKYLQTLLEVDGFDVETVGSGKEVISKVSDGERPDLIILDVLMPEMNGIDTLKELLQLDRSLNIIMLTLAVRGLMFPVSRRQAMAKPAVHAWTDEAERLLTMRETHQLTGIPPRPREIGTAYGAAASRPASA